MAAPRFSKLEKEDIVARYAAGGSSSEIAAEFGCDATYPSLLARRRGVQRNMTRSEAAKKHWERRWRKIAEQQR